MATANTAIVTSAALEITDGARRTAIDMASAMASAVGHRHPDIVRAIGDACQKHLGSSLDVAAAGQLSEAGEPFTGFADGCVVPSACEANEWAIRIARAVAEAASDGEVGSRDRVITLLGGIHGETLACRSASGLLAGQATGGPLAAGFRHIAPGDQRALTKAIDATVAAVLIAPVDWSRGGVPFEQDYLLAVRQCCDDSGALLIIDETRLPPAVSGHWFFHQAHNIQADIVTAAAGWTGGLPGGLLLLREQTLQRLAALAAETAADALSAERSSDQPSDPPSPRSQGLLPRADYPLLRSVIEATAAAVQAQGGPDHVQQIAPAWAAAWQELAEGFEFINRTLTAGLYAVAELDLSADEVVAAARKAGLALIASGETTLLACLPITVTPQAIGLMLQKLREALETIERHTIES